MSTELPKDLMKKAMAEKANKYPTEYKVVTARSAEELSKAVTKLLNEGWWCSSGYGHSAYSWHNLIDDCTEVSEVFSQPMQRYV